MRTLALLIGLLVLVLGVLGFIVPDTYLIIARHAVTPVGLYLVALFRMAIGLVFIRVAPSSRGPLGLRVLGVFAFLSGLVTPLGGVQGARNFIEWWAEQGHGVMRAWALIAVVFGGFVVWAVTGERREIHRAPGIERPAT